MKAVLVGTDLMYRKDGSLAPIEINTNVGWDEGNRAESDKDLWQLKALAEYVREHNIEEIDFLPGIAQRIVDSLGEFQEYLGSEKVKIGFALNSGVKAEDAENKLIVRTAYSDEALVDSFCRDKIAFLESIKNTDLEVEYLLKTEDGFEGEITSVETGYPAGIPNFIMKYRYPNYDKAEYPKLCRFNSLEDLMDFAENMPKDFFLMPYYFCEDELYNGNRIKLVREWSLFVVNNEGGLDAVELGRYTKVCDKLDNLAEVEYEENGELKPEYRSLFLTTDWTKRSTGDTALLDANDLVWMADGSWKVASEIQVGDVVKSLEIPAKEGYNSKTHTGDYGITVEQLENETHYVDNKVKSFSKAAKFSETYKLNFTDGTDWYDTPNSSYPTVNGEGTVEFKLIKNIKAGDRVILISLKNTEHPTFVIKELESVEQERKLLDEGYLITLDGSHLFISRTLEDQQAYAAIEHNKDGFNCVDVLYTVSYITDSNLQFEWSFSQDQWQKGASPSFSGGTLKHNGSSIAYTNLSDSNWEYFTTNFTPPGNFLGIFAVRSANPDLADKVQDLCAWSDTCAYQMEFNAEKGVTYYRQEHGTSSSVGSTCPCPSDTDVEGYGLAYDDFTADPLRTDSDKFSGISFTAGTYITVPTEWDTEP